MSRMCRVSSPISSALRSFPLRRRALATLGGQVHVSAMSAWWPPPRARAPPPTRACCLAHAMQAAAARRVSFAWRTRMDVHSPAARAGQRGVSAKSQHASCLCAAVREAPMWSRVMRPERYPS